MEVDLHMHSTASDGTDTPAELAELARRLGLAAIALTDHDTVGGLRACAAACERVGVRFVPGIELSADPGRPRGTMHILGYFIGENAPTLTTLIEQQREARDTRNPQIVEKLNELGIDISIEEVIAKAGEAPVGRPHIASVLIDKGAAASVTDAFTKYLGAGAPAHVRRDRVPAERAVEAIHVAGGLAVLAHPVQLRCDSEPELEQRISDLIYAGLDGLEVYHPDHTPRQVEQYEALARQFNLLITGGSDYHGTRKNIAMGSQHVPMRIYEKLAAAHARRA